MDQFDKHSQFIHQDATPLLSSNDILRPEERPLLVSKEKDIESATADTETRAAHSQAKVLDVSRSQLPHAAVPAGLSDRPVAMNLQGAHIDGNPMLANVGRDYVAHTVNNYGATNGLEKLEKFVSFEAQFDSSAQDPDRQCHPGTRENVLKTLRNWVDNPNSTDRIYWLHGPAGAGKSAIAQTIARSYARSKVAASFFFFRSDIKRNDGNLLFTTLAYQLALSIPEIRDHIVRSLSERPDLPRTNAETQFEKLLVRPFQAFSEDASKQLLAPDAYPIVDIVKKYQQLAPVIIIDGVDECTSDDLQRRFLKVIGDAVRDDHLPLRFLIVSRPELHIEQTIYHFKPPALTMDLAKLDGANRDIWKYLVDEFSRIASEQGLDPKWPGQEIIGDIVYKSSGNFIFPSLVIRFVGDPDNIAETQLNIVLNIKLPTTMTPFALLDQLFVEILSRVPDQVFLLRYLTLLVARISASINDDDDAVLMHVSGKELHAKLRRMRSILKFEPRIDLHHRSFLDFLHDSTRSRHYYVRKQEGERAYLEVFVDSLVRYVSAVIEQPDHHNALHFAPRFRKMVNLYPPEVTLPVYEWQEVVQPLLDLQEKILQLPDSSSRGCLCCDQCTAFNLLREFQQQAVLKALSADRVVKNMLIKNSQIRKDAISPIATKAAKNADNGLDRVLLALFALLPKTMENWSPNKEVIRLMDAILRFNCAETARRVRSVPHAQKLVSFLNYIIHSKNALHQDVMHTAGLLALEIFARVTSVFPSSFVNINDGSHHCIRHGPIHIEILSQTIFAGNILDHRYIVPVFGVMKPRVHRVRSMREWRLGSIPSSVTIIQIMLRLAKAIQYLHSMGVVLYRQFLSDHVLLDLKLYPKICCLCSTSQSLLDKECQDWFLPEDNIFSFGRFFYEMYTGVGAWPDDSIDSRKCIITIGPQVPEIPEYAWQLIQRCCDKHPKSRPSIDDIVNEMQGWQSTGHVELDEVMNEVEGGNCDGVKHIESDETMNGLEGRPSVGHVEPDEIMNGLEGRLSVGHVKLDEPVNRVEGSTLSDLQRGMYYE